MKIHPVGAELYHVGERGDGHDEADSRFPQFWNASKNEHKREPYKKNQSVPGSKHTPSRL